MTGGTVTVTVPELGLSASAPFEIQSAPADPFGTMGPFPPAACKLFGPTWRGQANLLDSSGHYLPVAAQMAPIGPYIAEGLILSLVVRHAIGMAQEIPVTDVAGCRAALNRLFDTLPPVGTQIVVSNEPTIEWPANGAATWATWCAIVAEEAHKRGWMVGAPGMLFSAATAIANPGSDPAIEARARAFLTRLKAAGVDVYVIHSYEDDVAAFKRLIDGSRAAFDGPIEINEGGLRVPETDTTTGPAICQAVIDKAVPRMLWYAPGTGLKNPTRLMLANGTRTPAGQSIVDFRLARGAWAGGQ